MGDYSQMAEQIIETIRAGLPGDSHVCVIVTTPHDPEDHAKGSQVSYSYSMDPAFLHGILGEIRKAIEPINPENSNDP